MRNNIENNWQCRWSPTLGALENTHQEVWGTQDYEVTRKLFDDTTTIKMANIYQPTVFFGMYGLPDFYALWRHKGERHILWAGTDIIHFKNGYWLEDGGGIKLDPKPLAEWINKNCESWCENGVEQKALKELGIESFVCPSFLGDVNNFPISKKRTDKKRYYASVSGDNFEQYGWPKINELARQNPNNEYHLYGNIKEWIPDWNNMIIHGRVPKEVMNEEIKSMTGCIRLLDFDGFSEVVAKAVLMGQEVISSIEYPFLKAENPREELIRVLNKYPWNANL